MTHETLEQAGSRPSTRGTYTTVETVNDALKSTEQSGRRGVNLKVPGLQWHKKYDEVTLEKPRVLMIDYNRKDIEQIRRVEAQEFESLDDLKKVYRKERSAATALRVFHVQNCDWGTDYLLRRFKLDRAGSRTQDFARWVRDKSPPKRAGKPLMAAKTWKTHADPWRGVARTAFGMDYMKHYNCEDGPVAEDRVLALEGFDSEENPIHAYDIHSQRLSVYVQYKFQEPITPDEDLECPYGSDPESAVKRFDNGSTIIIFDNSTSNSIEDTLMSARGAWESKWRRLPFTITHSTDVISEDAQICINSMKAILQDVFMSVVAAWEGVLEVSWEHVSILEDGIYERPADESRAPILWANSANWLRYEKLMFYHVDTVTEMKRYLSEMTELDPVEGTTLWLEDVHPAFDKLSNLIQEDLVKPTANLSDLMYKSVGIRDSRASLQLGTSMWRLSWITFIFLPLTFIVGFFGMNVSTFGDSTSPSIKWFFIAACPFFAAVFLGWYILKHLLARHRRAPMQRGLYENLFNELQETHPALWTRQGPKDIEPTKFISRIKWRIIKYWTSDAKLPRKPTAEDEPIGAWNRFKRLMIKRWTPQIEDERHRGVHRRRRGGRRRRDDDADLELGEVLTVNIEERTQLPGLGTVMVTDVTGKSVVIGGSGKGKEVGGDGTDEKNNNNTTTTNINHDKDGIVNITITKEQRKFTNPREEYFEEGNTGGSQRKVIEETITPVNRTTRTTPAEILRREAELDTPGGGGDGESSGRNSGILVEEQRPGTGNQVMQVRSSADEGGRCGHVITMKYPPPPPAPESGVP
ncbi:hypothetical protein DFH27DRAFT_142453 [Peziza echinospora]|nr:hypothetical protein DFH27DRAFT_142453 [Peziza echinospora]